MDTVLPISAPDAGDTLRLRGRHCELLLAVELGPTRGASLSEDTEFAF